MQSRKDRAQSLAARSRFWIDDLHVQPDRCVVMRGEEEIKLEQRMMEVLVELAENGGKPVSTGALLDEFWSDDAENKIYDENPVTKTISTLRSKIGDVAHKPRYIRTINKLGYCIIPKVQLAEGYRHVHREFGTWTRGNPYVGLKPFDQGHAEVFQGRSATVADLMRAMREQIDNERRFVLIIGPSGCGKTSLVHASMIPTVAKKLGFDGLHALSVATCDLGTASDGDLMAVLAASLTAWKIGGHELFSLHPQEHLRKMLSESPEKISAVIGEGFRRYPVRGIEKQPHFHLLLTIDHAESLIAARNVSPEQRSCFARAIRALCDTPRILTTMIARLDFYPALADALPELADYRSGHGHFEVSTPSEGELAKIIRKPAALAGVDFEEHPKTQVFLDDLLCKKAIAQPDALPLLQHTLHALFEQCGETGLMTYAAYEEIGGLEGAIARRAEEVFGGLSMTAGDKKDRILGRIFACLVVIQSDSGAVSASPIVRSRLDSEANQMIQAFIDAHLFVSDLDGGQPIVKVAHEALLRQWPRAAKWIEENRRLLQAKGRLQRATLRWAEEGRSPDHLLNPGGPLSEAREVAMRFPEDFDQDIHRFVRDSEKESLRKRRVRSVATISLFILTMLSIAFALIALQARDKAEKRERESRQLSEFLLGPLADELRRREMLAVLGQVGSEAINYLEARDLDDLDPIKMAKTARAYRTVGEALLLTNNPRQAEASFRRARALAEISLKTQPSNEVSIFERGNASYWIGYVDYMEKRYAAAKIHWLDYQDDSRSLITISPENPDWLLENSYADNVLGTLALRQGETDSAMEQFESAISRKMALKATNKDNLDYQYDYIDSLSWRASTLEATGRLSEASTQYDRQIEMLSSLIRENKTANRWWSRLANYMMLSATLEIGLGKTRKANARALEAVRILEQISKFSPEGIEVEKDLAKARLIYAEAAGLLSDHVTESAQLQKVLETISDLDPKTRSQTSWSWISARARFTYHMTGTAPPNNSDLDKSVSDISLLAKSNESEEIMESYAYCLLLRGMKTAKNSRKDLAMADFSAVTSVIGKTKWRSNPFRSWIWSRAQTLSGNPEAAIRTDAWLSAIGYSRTTNIHSH